MSYRLGTRVLSGRLLFAASFVGLLVLANPLSVGAATYGTAQGGNTYVEGGLVIKTAIVPQKAFVPEELISRSCGLSINGGCVGAASQSQVQLNDQWACAENPDTSCTGQDPKTAGCTADAAPAADDWVTYDNGHTYYVLTRWSNKCQSNWGIYEDTTAAADLSVGNSYTYMGTYEYKTDYNSPNVTEVYGNMLYGGRGEPCVDTVGNYTIGQWVFWNPKCV